MQAINLDLNSLGIRFWSSLIWCMQVPQQPAANLKARYSARSGHRWHRHSRQPWLWLVGLIWCSLTVNAAAQDQRAIQQQAGIKRVAQQKQQQRNHQSRQQAAQQAAQKAQQAKQNQNRAVQSSIDKALARQRNPQPRANHRLSHTNARNVVIGSSMSHVRSQVAQKNMRNKTGNQAHYRGVPNALNIRINLRAQQKGNAARQRAYSQGLKRGLTAASAQHYAKAIARLTAKNYRDSRYMKHNQAFIRWTIKREMKIVDVGYGSKAKSSSPFLSGERKTILSEARAGRTVKYKVDKNAKTSQPRTWPPKK
jgi:hypothetical protein